MQELQAPEGLAVCKIEDSVTDGHEGDDCRIVYHDRKKVVQRISIDPITGKELILSTSEEISRHQTTEITLCYLSEGRLEDLENHYRDNMGNHIKKIVITYGENIITILDSILTGFSFSPSVNEFSLTVIADIVNITERTQYKP